MPTPQPDVQVRMIDNMLKRKYKFQIGDIVKIHDPISQIREDVFTTIKYPYYYDIENEQSYITELNPIPYKDSELELLGKNPNGEKQTIEYLQKCRDEADSQEYRDKWVYV